MRLPAVVREQARTSSASCRGLARVPLAHVALGDRAPVLVRAAWSCWARSACSGRSSPTRSSAAPGVGPDPHGWSAGLVAGGLLGLRFRPRRMLLAATLGILAMPLPLIALGVPAQRARRSPRPRSSPGSGSRSSGCSGTRRCSRRSRPTSSRASTPTTRSARSCSSRSATRSPARSRTRSASRATLWGAAAIVIVVTLAVLLVHDVRTLERRVAHVGSRRCPAPPVPPEIEEFLRKPNPAVVATIRPDGSPHSVATWYDLGRRADPAQHGRDARAARPPAGATHACR